MSVHHYRSRCLSKGKSQQGFTLIELLVAMTIFAVLAVAGWQVFASLNRTKEQTQLHKQTLSEVQYAYLQLQKDFAQVVPWQQVTANNAQLNRQITDNQASSQVIPQANSSQSNSNQALVNNVKPAFQLNANGVSFIRFADADPRYPLTPALVKVSYHLHDGRLLRSQSYAIDNTNDDTSNNALTGITEIADKTTAVVLGRHGNVNALQWQAFTPQAVTAFGVPADATATSPDNSQSDHLLPRGVGVSFDYMGESLQWQFVVGGADAIRQAGDGHANQN